MSREKETEGEQKYVPSLSHAIVYLLQRYPAYGGHGNAWISA